MEATLLVVVLDHFIHPLVGAVRQDERDAAKD